MTTSTAMDINTFCALPIHIETIVDRDGEEWFVLDDQLCALLKFPKDLGYQKLLSPGDWASNYLDDDSNELKADLLSEAGMYMLILLSQAEAIQPFKSWVLDVVAPTLAEDSLYMMGEETLFHPPTGYDLTHDEVWSGDLDGSGSAYELANVYLPMLRQKGTAEMMAYIMETADGDYIGVPDYTLATQRKNERKRSYHCAA